VANDGGYIAVLPHATAEAPLALLQVSEFCSSIAACDVARDGLERLASTVVTCAVAGVVAGAGGATSSYSPHALADAVGGRVLLPLGQHAGSLAVAAASAATLEPTVAAAVREGLNAAVVAFDTAALTAANAVPGLAALLSREVPTVVQVLQEALSAVAAVGVSSAASAVLVF
jgi:hypothetical protein